MLMVCFHIILQLYFSSAGGEVSCVDFFFFPHAKAQYNEQLFNIIETIFKCDFSIIKKKVYC